MCSSSLHRVCFRSCYCRWLSEKSAQLFLLWEFHWVTVYVEWPSAFPGRKIQMCVQSWHIHHSRGGMLSFLTLWTFPFSFSLSLSVCLSVRLFLAVLENSLWCIRVGGFKRWRSFPAKVSSLSSFFLNSSLMIPELTVCLPRLWYLHRKKHCKQYLHLKRTTHQFTVVTSHSHLF